MGCLGQLLWLLFQIAWELIKLLSNLIIPALSLMGMVLIAIISGAFWFAWQFCKALPWFVKTVALFVWEFLKLIPPLLWFAVQAIWAIGVDIIRLIPKIPGAIRMLPKFMQLMSLVNLAMGRVGPGIIVGILTHLLKGWWRSLRRRLP